MTPPSSSARFWRHVAVLMVVASALSACSFYPSQPGAAARVGSVVASETSLTLYTLDPAQRTGGSGHGDGWFHGFRILGQTVIVNETERQALLEAFQQGITNSPAVAAFCFNPRHGLTLRTGASQTDYVICFECRSVRSYSPSSRFRIGTSPRDTFNEIATAHHLPIAGAGAR